VEAGGRRSGYGLASESRAALHRRKIGQTATGRA
jgi:hypothetical protein